jgi:hypothetical protein
MLRKHITNERTPDVPSPPDEIDVPAGECPCCRRRFADAG